MQYIPKYFSELSEHQLKQLEDLHGYLLEWNERLNLVSRPDAENLEERHLLSSLSIAKFIQFPKGSRIMDVGDRRWTARTAARHFIFRMRISIGR